MSHNNWPTTTRLYMLLGWRSSSKGKTILLISLLNKLNITSGNNTTAFHNTLFAESRMLHLQPPPNLTCHYTVGLLISVAIFRAFSLVIVQRCDWLTRHVFSLFTLMSGQTRVNFQITTILLLLMITKCNRHIFCLTVKETWKPCNNTHSLCDFLVFCLKHLI